MSEKRDLIIVGIAAALWLLARFAFWFGLAFVVMFFALELFK